LNAQVSKACDHQIAVDFSPGSAGMELLEQVDAAIGASELQSFKVIREPGSGA
jgi:hypothetical protein